MKILLAIDPRQPHAAYRDALLAAGALPEEVEIVQPGGVLPEEFDGLLLSGGADVDPSRYGEAKVNGSVRTSVERDGLDFELFSRAERLGVPVFGICRGLQVLNVALGGTLWQDLPAQRSRGVEHSFSTSDGHDPAHPAHEIRAARIPPRTLPLSVALAATDGLRVNSRHHQAVKELAPGLVALATSPDGLVEAFARESGPFLAAVQWHPENLIARADQKALFEAFLAAARPRAARAKSPHETPLGTLDIGEPSSPAVRGSDKKPEPA
ncbi:MAG: type 1 glutamine amidotransferase [Holophagales bacterium]|jgi:putative glutamine amidotransferase|nr:type 1 glutamine amidotransferase [Holophagales bacterium]MBK9964892.1 type 1 glutamine amidotransferase [Holophagales bacterium]